MLFRSRPSRQKKPHARDESRRRAAPEGSSAEVGELGVAATIVHVPALGLRCLQSLISAFAGVLTREFPLTRHLPPTASVIVAMTQRGIHRPPKGRSWVFRGFSFFISGFACVGNSHYLLASFFANRPSNLPTPSHPSFSQVETGRKSRKYPRHSEATR